MITQLVDGVEITTHLGWFWNRFELRWEYMVTAPGSRREVIRIASEYDLDNPPWFSPYGVA